jgi:hypothetical protein
VRSPPPKGDERGGCHHRAPRRRDGVCARGEQPPALAVSRRNQGGGRANVRPPFSFAVLHIHLINVLTSRFHELPRIFVGRKVETLLRPGGGATQHRHHWTPRAGETWSRCQGQAGRSHLSPVLPAEVVVPYLVGRHPLGVQHGRVQKWINAIPGICQCCAQGKDARRDEKRRRCCALSVRRCCKDAPSARTVSDIRACLRAALNHVICEELIGRNVAELVTLPTVRKRKRTAWTSEEARKFLESARDARDAMYAGYVLAVVLGLRKREILDSRGTRSTSPTASWRSTTSSSGPVANCCTARPRRPRRTTPCHCRPSSSRP